MTTESFDRLLEYVETELSFATSHYNDSYLDRRITSRMRRTDSGSYDAYLRHLRETPDEQVALLESMSINVTGFFRNPDVWEGIRAVVRDLAANGASIRIWSAACADGREPYSLAMLAYADPEIDESAVEVLGTDISEPALETARAGTYEELRTVDMADQLSFLDDYSNYVEQAGRTYRLTDPIRDTVTFERHDLINDDPKSGFDLVTCRNLFIYIDNEYKTSMLETIERSLRPEGYLVIGKSETISSRLQSTFSVHDSQLRIYRNRPDST